MLKRKDVVESNTQSGSKLYCSCGPLGREVIRHGCTEAHCRDQMSDQAVQKILSTFTVFMGQWV